MWRDVIMVTDTMRLGVVMIKAECGRSYADWRTGVFDKVSSTSCAMLCGLGSRMARVLLGG